MEESDIASRTIVGDDLDSTQGVRQNAIEKEESPAKNIKVCEGHSRS